MRGRRKKQKPNMEEVEPRRSLRLAKKNVTMGRQGTVDDPEVLPYYMEAAESGYAGTRQSEERGVTEEEDTPVQASDGQSDTAGQGDVNEGLDEAAEGAPRRSSRVLQLLCWLGMACDREASGGKQDS